MAGQVKSVKPSLKQLQQSIQAITSLHSDDGEYSICADRDDEPVNAAQADLFQWLPKEHMCVLVYLVSSTLFGL
jgi:MAternally-affected-uncoordination protein